jgi:predicted metalloprotease with PDZ domain
MTWQEAKDRLEAIYPDAWPVAVTSVIRVRYRIYAGGKLWGDSQKTVERAYLSAAKEMRIS